MNLSAGVRLRPSSSATRACKKPCALRRPRRLSSRSRSPPSTLTYTRACLRSGLVLTSVTVMNPTRGSFTSPASASPITWRIASSTRRILGLLILPSGLARHPALRGLLHERSLIFALGLGGGRRRDDHAVAAAAFPPPAGSAVRS